MAIAPVPAVAVAIAFLLGAPRTGGTQVADSVTYYHGDAVGSVRMATDETGQVVGRFDYWPFGTPVDSSYQTLLQFAGGERDAETSWLYLGLRYAESQSGRFTSPDPVTVNALRLVNPQRWNRYAYALNNPLKYVDPDGLDALLVNFTDGTRGLGHIGIMALYRNGSGLYGGFNPEGGGRLIDRGAVELVDFPPGAVDFGLDGRPTGASMRYLEERLAMADGRSPGAVRIRHIKTTDSEAAALEAYMRRVHESQPLYVLAGRDCLDFCLRGLWTAGIPAPPTSAVLGGAIPNRYFESFLLDVASRMAEWFDRPTPRVDTSYCVQGIDCR